MDVQTPRKIYRLGLATQLIILVVIVTIIIGGTLGAVLTNTSADSLKQNILRNNLIQADLAAQYTGNYIKAVRAHVEVFVRRPDIRQAVLDKTFPQVQEVLAQFVQIQKGLDSCNLYDPNGIQMVSSLADATTIGQSFADQEWFQQVAATGQPYLGMAVMSRITGKPVMPYTIPIFDDRQQLQGILTAGISLGVLSDTIVDLDYGLDTRVSIICLKHGIILAHPDSTRILTKVSEDEAVTRMTAGERGAIETRTSNGEPSIIGFTPVPDLPWGVMVITPTSSALAPMNKLIMMSILITIIFVLAVGLLGGIFMVRITRPLVKLRNATQRLAAGDINFRINLNQKNEIGELGNEFNRMANALAEKELQVHNHAVQLEESNKELEAFAYSVSHDLRAPLRSIDGFSQALLEDYNDKLDSTGQNYLRRVRAAAQNMGQLIDDILNLSRVTRYEMKKEKVNLSSLAREITDELSKAQPERQVSVGIAGDLTAKGDPNLLRIMLTNLLDNAFKFTGKHPLAKIEFGSIQKNGQTVFFIRDNGVGFEMKYADKLFTPFQRLHTTNEFPGTGIGLAVVQRIVHRHGGKVWAESEVEKGAAFYFTLE